MFTTRYSSTMTVTKDTTVGRSPRMMAWNRVLPTPGTLKMPSVTVAPTMRMPESAPNWVVTGISELRRMCTGTTRPRLRPLLYAVRTKSADPVSMTDDRVSRIEYATVNSARTIAGSASRWIDVSAPTVAGNQCSWMPKKYWPMKQRTKIGTDTSRRLTTSAVASKMP